MSRKRKITIALLLIVFIATTPIFARLKTNYFSAYAACQNTAMTIKGNKAWEYQRTIPGMFQSDVFFSDGYNFLQCATVGIGPFWVVLITAHGCYGNTSEICPPSDSDYFID